MQSLSIALESSELFQIFFASVRLPPLPGISRPRHFRNRSIRRRTSFMKHRRAERLSTLESAHDAAFLCCTEALDFKKLFVVNDTHAAIYFKRFRMRLDDVQPLSFTSPRLLPRCPRRRERVRHYKAIPEFTAMRRRPSPSSNLFPNSSSLYKVSRDGNHLKRKPILTFGTAQPKRT